MTNLISTETRCNDSSTCYIANNSTKLIFLTSTILFSLFTLVLFSEGPGLISFVALFSTLFLLTRAIYYFRLKVRIDDTGLWMRPGNRNIQWLQVEQVIYANRRLRYDGAPLPRRQSLQLKIFRQPSVDLPHRFKNMTSLITQVIAYVEPVLLQRAGKHFREHGKISFGAVLDLTGENVILVKKNQIIPRGNIEEICIVNGTFLIVGKDGKTLFSDLVEMIPNALIIPELFTTSNVRQTENTNQSMSRINPNKETKPPVTTADDILQLGIASEMNRLSGLPYLTIQFSQEYDYDGLYESLKLLEGFKDLESASFYIECLAAQTLAESLKETISKAGNWRHDTSVGDKRFKACQENSLVRGVYLKRFRIVSDSGYDSMNIQFEVLTLGDCQSVGPELLKYYDAKDEWKSYFRSKEMK